MHKLSKTFLGGFAVVGVISVAGMLTTTAFAQEKDEAREKSGSMTAPIAKISPVQAMKIAAGKTGGKVSKATFEFEDGHWIYGVIVAKNHKLLEVEIDATTGKVGDSESITPAGEAKEYQQELTKLAKSSG